VNEQTHFVESAVFQNGGVRRTFHDCFGKKGVFQSAFSLPKTFTVSGVK